MIITVQTEIHDSDLAAFIEGDAEDRAKIAQELFENLEEDQQGELLGWFCTGEREVYDSYPIVIGAEMEDAVSGSVFVSFEGSADFGCRDINVTNEYDETVTFKISPKAKRITFTTEPPDRIERPPNEEF